MRNIYLLDDAVDIGVDARLVDVLLGLHEPPSAAVRAERCAALALPLRRRRIPVSAQCPDYAVPVQAAAVIVVRAFCGAEASRSLGQVLKCGLVAVQSSMHFYLVSQP